MTDAVQRALRLFEIGRYDEAREVVGVVLASELEDPTAMRLLVMCHLNLGRPMDALRAANRLVAAEPGDAEGHRLASVALQRLRQGAEAHRAAASAVRLGPLDAANHVQLALTSTSKAAGRTAAARAVELDPHDDDAHFAVGFTARSARQRRAAYRRALAINPTHSGAANNLQVARGRTLSLNSLARGYLAVLEHDPSYETARLNLVGLTYRFVRRYYWLGVLLVIAGIGLTGTADRRHWWPWAPATAAVAAVLGVGYAVLTWRQLPPGPRVFLLRAWRSRAHLVAVTVHTAAVLLCGVVLLTVPVPAVTALATLAVTPLVWLNIALFVWGLRSRPRR